MRKARPRPAVKLVRCVIRTRKSTLWSCTWKYTE
jgi:hypothetical protein